VNIRVYARARMQESRGTPACSADIAIKRSRRKSCSWFEGRSGSWVRNPCSQQGWSVRVSQQQPLQRHHPLPPPHLPMFPEERDAPYQLFVVTQGSRPMSAASCTSRLATRRAKRLEAAVVVVDGQGRLAQGHVLRQCGWGTPAVGLAVGDNAKPYRTRRGGGRHSTGGAPSGTSCQ
jgi:hypothetical protein